jgi:formamidopyrimidine-DNA glycosylase
LKLKLDFAGEGKSDGLFYFGSASTQAPQSRERFRVYGREGEACPTCGSKIVRAEQSKRGTFFCPQCQQRE